MSTPFDQLFRDLAVRLVDDTFGRDATLRVPTKTYSAATGRTTVVNTDYAVKITPPSGATPGGSRPGSGDQRIAGVTQGGEARVTLAAASLPAGVIPRIGHEVIIDDVRYEVVEVYSINSGALAAAYTLGIRA
jgi:hypothetical protein